MLPRRKGLSSSSWDSKHKPMNQDKGHWYPSQLPELASCHGPPSRTVYLPSDEDQVQLMAESLWPHPIPHRWERKEDTGQEKLPQGPQVELLKKNPREEWCWWLPGSTDSRSSKHQDHISSQQAALTRAGVQNAHYPCRESTMAVRKELTGEPWCLSAKPCCDEKQAAAL